MHFGAELVAWWGAVLSTLLALIKLFELWRDRFRLEISYKFAGYAPVGNEITIRNLSTRPVIVGHWELLYGKWYWPIWGFESFDAADHDAGDLRIEAHDTYSLMFVDERWFDWGADALNGRTIYIRLYIAGRTPIVRKVYAL